MKVVLLIAIFINLLFADAKSDLLNFLDDEPKQEVNVKPKQVNNTIVVPPKKDTQTLPKNKESNSDIFAKARKAWDEGNKKKAVDLYKKACNGGYMKGCNNLGVMHDKGDGIKQDKKVAVDLYKKACDGGYVGSCNNLGNMYKNGYGIKQDKKKAVELYKKACDGGGITGCGNLGNMYKNGYGIKQDKKKASDLYKKACDGGYMASCNNLGAMYSDGDGIKQDKKKASDLYKKACDGGYVGSCYNLGLMYDKGDEIKQDKQKAINLYKKACDGGILSACNNLGLMYNKGDGIKQDKQKAKDLYKKACDGGGMTGCNNLKILKKEESALINPKPFGLQIGQATIKEVKKKFKLKDNGINKYSQGKMFNLNPKDLDFDGLKEATIIFSKDEKLLAILLKMPKSKFYNIFNSLDSKYKLLNQKTPRLGDKNAKFISGNTEISISAAHVGFSMDLEYIDKSLWETYNQIQQKEKEEKKNKERSQL